MSPNRVKQPSGSVRGAALAGAAAAVFARDGYHGATVADIARQAGVGTGTFYLYFPSKETCFLDLIARFYEEVLAQVAAARHGVSDTLGKLEASVRSVLGAFDAHRDLSTIVLLRTGGSTPGIEQALLRIEDEFWRLLSEDLEEAAAAGNVPPGDSGLRARLVMGAISDALLYGLRSGSLTLAQQDEVARFVMGALAPDPI